MDEKEIALVVGLIRDIILKDKIDTMDDLVKKMMEYDSERGSVAEPTSPHDAKTNPPEKIPDIKQCRKCKKQIEKSADKHIRVCKECLDGIKKDFKQGYKPWDELKPTGKATRIKIAIKKEQNHIKEVYNPDTDPIQT